MGHNSSAPSFFKGEGKNIVLCVELHLAAKALIVKRVEDYPPCSVCGMAGSLHGFFAVIACMSPEIPLCNLSFCIATEWNAHVLKLIDYTGGIPDHDLDSILISEVIAPLDCIEHMPFPAVFFLVAYGSGDSSLGCA